MLATKISSLAANAEADALGALLNGGYLRVFGGDKPLDADTPSTEVAIAELRFAEVAFRPADGGAISSNPLTPDLNTAGEGEPTWFRCFMADGVTPVFDGSIGAAGCNLNIQTTNGAPLFVYPGGEFHVGSVSYTARRG